MSRKLLELLPKGEAVIQLFRGLLSQGFWLNAHHYKILYAMENFISVMVLIQVHMLVKALMSHKWTCSFIIICFTGICDTAQIIVKSGSSLFLTGSDIQIRCKCYMNPSGTYTFSKDGATLNSGGHITVDRNKVLIKNATTEDSGSYTCTASSPSSSTKTPDSPLSISVIGMFKKSPFLFCKLLFSLWIAVKGKNHMNSWVGDSEFFFVPHSWHADYFIFTFVHQA